MSLQVWLPLDGRLDNFGLADITVTNYGATVDNNGKIGKCYNFNGTSSRILINNIPKPKDLTVAFWMKRNSTTNSRQFLFNYWPGFSIELTVNNTLFGYLAGNKGRCDYSEVITENTGWIHVCYTVKDKVNTNLYINGQKVATCSFNSSIGWGTQTDANIEYLSSSYYGNGKINDIRVYDHCLSAKEVKEISKGLVRHYPLNEIIGKPNLLRNTSFSAQHNQTAWNTSKNGNKEPDYCFCYNSGVSNPSTCYHAHLVQFSGEQVVEYIQETESWLGVRQSGIQVYLTPGNTYTLSIWQYIPQGSNKYLTGQIFGHFQNGTSSTTIVSFYCDSNRIYNKWQKFVFNLTLPTNTDCSRDLTLYIYGTAGGQGTVYMRRPKLEKGSEATPWVPNINDAEYSSYDLGNVVYDCSGYGRNGSLSPTPPTYGSQSPRYFNCMAFNGTNNYIDCGLSGDGNLPTDAITVCGWGYQQDWTTTSNHRLISCTESGGFNFQGYTDQFIIYINGTYKVASSNSNTWNKSTGWHFFVGTYDGYTTKFYIDGQLAGSTATASTKYPITYYSNAKLFIGCEPSGATPSSPYWNGKISDIRIYCTALSAQDIKELYQSSLSVDNMGNFHTHEIFENTEAQS